MAYLAWKFVKFFVD